MAAAFFHALADPAIARAISAGTQPADRVHAEVVEIMNEVHFDLAGTTPTLLSEDLARAAQLLVTMGCGETCPVVPGCRRMEWDIPDPKGQPRDRVREIRDEIRRRVAALISAEGWQR